MEKIIEQALSTTIGGVMFATILGVGIALGMYISSQIKCHIRSNINRKKLLKNINKKSKNK